MGTCIGHQNRRFFVNFLTYLNSGIILILILLKHTSATRENRDVSTFLFVLFLTLGMFCLFHWLLVFSGRTTLEICFIDDGYRPRCNFRKNLIIVFGTANVLKIFLPINRTLPYEGFEWEDEDIWASDRPKMNEKIPSNDDI